MRHGDQADERSSVWTWFWYGVVAGAIYSAWRYPSGMCCCLVILLILAVLAGLFVVVFVWTQWQVALFIVLIVLLIRWARRSEKERHF